MDVFTFVIIVVIVGCGSGVLMEYLKNKREASTGEVDEGVQQDLASLRERIEVLERIVTDEKYHLKKELDQLERTS
jgi:hypothetical protein